MNEGGCDLAGGFVCGSMAYDKHTGAATVYRLDPDGTVEVVLDRVTISNGFSLDPTGRLPTTPTRRPTGSTCSTSARTAGPCRSPPVRRHRGRRRMPDGLTVDADGGVWVALYGGSAVRRYATGRHAGHDHPRADPQVTACTFGGRDLGTLFITTSQEDLDRDGRRLAGTLFAVRPGGVGLPPLPFRG